MRPSLIPPPLGLPTTRRQAAAQAGDTAAPLGFELLFAQALAAEPAPADPELTHGPADFGLWGGAPDGEGRLDLDEVARHLRTTLATFGRNLGNACRSAAIVLPPALILELDAAGAPLLPGDPRELPLRMLFGERPALARQGQRLLAGFAFVRHGDALRAYAQAVVRLGPARLAAVLGEHGDAHASPRLALWCDGETALPLEFDATHWRPLTGQERLLAELLEAAPGLRPGAAATTPAMEPNSASLLLRAALARQGR